MSLLDWYEEDSEEFNKKCETARKLGLTIDVEGETPELKKDGSLVEDE